MFFLWVILFCELYSPGLKQYGDFDLAGVLHGLFDLRGDVARQAGGCQGGNILLSEVSHYSIKKPWEYFAII